MMPYSEYLLCLQATTESDRQKKADLIQALETRNPQSQYLASAKQEPARMNPIPMDSERAFAIAEKGLAQDAENEDYLMTMADYYMHRERDLAKVLSYSLRLLEALPKRQRPEGASAEDWERKKARYTGAGDWMAGIVYGKQGRYGLSDRYLRASLAYIHDNSQALAAAYFYLGYDNYAIAGELRDKSRAVEAAKYSRLCLTIDGPFQTLAQKNLEVLRNEYNVE